MKLSQYEQDKLIQYYQLKLAKTSAHDTYIKYILERLNIILFIEDIDLLEEERLHLITAYKTALSESYSVVLANKLMELL